MNDIILLLGKDRNIKAKNLSVRSGIIQDIDTLCRYYEWKDLLDRLYKNRLDINSEAIYLNIFTTDNKEFIQVFAEWLQDKSFNFKCISQNNEDIWIYNKEQFIKAILEYGMELRGV